MPGFVLMVAAQWYAPLSMIYDSQETIEEGTEYKFKTAPVDPTDPFRGKYITLGFEEEIYYPKDTNEARFDYGQKVYAVLGTDSLGFAKIMRLTDNEPVDLINDGYEFRSDYILVEFTYKYTDADNNPVVNLQFPFKRYYLEESKASEAEQLSWNNRSDTSKVCYATVSIHNGSATLTNVMVNDSSIVDIVRRMNAVQE